MDSKHSTELESGPIIAITHTLDGGRVHQPLRHENPKQAYTGAPVVHQEDIKEEISNLCAGFFSGFDGTNVLVPTLDYLLDRGWDSQEDTGEIRRSTEITDRKWTLLFIVLSKVCQLGRRVKPRPGVL